MIQPVTNLFKMYPELLFFGALTLFTSTLLMQASIRIFSLRRITIPAAFFFTYLIMIFFPSFAVYADRPGPFRETYIAAVLITLITVPAGIFFADVIARFKYQETRQYFDSSPKESPPFGGIYLAHLLVLAAVLFLFLHYFLTVPVVPIFEMIRHPRDTEALTMARELSFKLLDPRWGGPDSTVFFYGYLFMRTVLFPLLIMTTLGYALYTKKLQWGLLAAGTFLAGSFYAVSSLSRAPISAIFMRVFIFLLLFYGSRIGKKFFVGFTALMLTFPVIVTTFAYSSTNTLLDGLLSVGRRLTYTPALDLYYYFEIFPGVHEYLYGHSIIKPILKLLGASYFYIENYVALYISPFGVKSAHANAAFLSNLNADFGLAGVVLGGFLAGTIMQLLHIFLVRSPKNILNMAVYSFMVYAIWVLNFGSVTSVLLVNGVLPVFILVGALRGLAVLLERRNPAPLAANPSETAH